MPLEGARVLQGARSQIGGTTRPDTVGARLVPIPEACLAALHQHKARQAQEKLRLGPAYQDHSLVFCRPDGTPMAPETLPKTFTRLITQAGLPLSDSMMPGTPLLL